MKILKDVKAGVSPTSIIMVVIALFLAGVLLPLSMRGFFTANYTGLDATVITVFTVLIPILAGIGIALKFLKQTKTD